jgi:hypothetical protein
MAYTKKCTISTHIYGFSEILLMVHRRFFKDRKSDHGIAEEKQEVFMEQGMHGSISKAQGFVDENTDTKTPQHGQGIIGMNICIQGRFRQSIDARRSNDRLHLKEIKKARGKL